MNTFPKIRNFFQDETGAVTVDWIVLTAGLVGLAISTIILFSQAPEVAAERLVEQLETISGS